MPPYPDFVVGTLFCALNLLYLLKGQWLGLVPQLGHQLPNHQGILASYELGCGRREGGLGSCKPKRLSLSTSSDQQGHIYDHVSLGSPLF